MVWLATLSGASAAVIKAEGFRSPADLQAKQSTAKSKIESFPSAVAAVLSPHIQSTIAAKEGVLLVEVITQERRHLPRKVRRIPFGDAKAAYVSAH